MAGRKFQIGNVSLYIVKKGLFLSVYVDDIKLAGKKQNLDPMWKRLNEEVDLGEPTSFLDHENLGCNHVRISNFCGEIREITFPSKSLYFFMVL